MKLIFFSLKEEKEEDTQALVNEVLKNKLQIETTRLIEVKRLDKIIEHIDRLICVKIRSDDYKYGTLSNRENCKDPYLFKSL